MAKEQIHEQKPVKLSRGNIAVLNDKADFPRYVFRLFVQNIE